MTEPCLCSCESQRSAGLPVELVVNQDQLKYFISHAHVVIFGNVELYAFERSNLLYIPLDTIMLIIGKAASESLLSFISDSDLKLPSLDPLEALLLQQKCGFNRNNSCLDLISIEDFQSFCKKFTSSNISNPVIVEFALNSHQDKLLGSHVVCFYCGLLKDVSAMKRKDNDTSSNYVPVVENTFENDLTEVSVGFVNIGDTKMEAFAMRDNVYMSFKEIISYNVLQLFQIQKEMRELHVLPIRAPVEVNDFLIDGKSLNINTFWIDIETVISLVIKCKKRRRQTNPSLIPCLCKREYKYYSVAMINCKNLDLTVHSIAIDSKSLELVNIVQDTFSCVIQKDEPFIIIDKTVNAKKLALHQNCIGCCLKMKENKPKRREKRKKEMLPIPEKGLNSIYCLENQTSGARAKKVRRKDSDNDEPSDDLTAALASEPGDYIISDYDKFCELLQTRRTVGNDNPSSCEFTIYSEDDVACEFIEGEAECGNEFKDVNNNVSNEAMMLSRLDGSEDVNNLHVNESNAEVNNYEGESISAPHVLNSNENSLETNISDLCRFTTAATWDVNGDDERKLIENIKKYLVFSRVNETFRFEKFNDGAKAAFPALFLPTPDKEETIACRRAFIKSAEVKMSEWLNRESHETSCLSTRNDTPQTSEIMLNNIRKKGPSNRGQTKKRKLCDGPVGSSNSINNEQGEINVKRKKSVRKQSGNSSSSRNKNGRRSKCSRKGAKSVKDIDIDDAFDESFRIEIFESKQVQKIIVRNWNKFNELVEHVKENKSKTKERCFSSVDGNVIDKGKAVTNDSEKSDVVPDLMKYQNVNIDIPQNSSDRFTVNRYTSPIKMNGASDKDWIADHTSCGVQLNCYVQLTRMKWLDKLSQRFRVSLLDLHN